MAQIKVEAENVVEKLVTVTNIEIMLNHGYLEDMCRAKAEEVYDRLLASLRDKGYTS